MTTARRAGSPARSIRPLQHLVRMSARASGLLFAAALTAAVVAPARRAARVLYVAFAAAHAAHFAAVARLAVRTGGRDLFPGGRSLGDVGGWPALLSGYAAFGALVVIGRPRPARFDPVRRSLAHEVSTAGIGTLFVGTYLAQLPRSRWYAVRAATIAGPLLARLLTAGREHRP